MGIEAFRFEQVLGKKFKVNLRQWDFLKEEHIV